MKYYLIVISIGLSLLYLNLAHRSINPSITQLDSLRTVTITAVGDLMCHQPETDYARVQPDSFDFRPMFREVKNILSESDLTVGNLETTITGKESKFSGYPFFNSPKQFLEAIKDAGFDLLFTSNNHCLDRGKKGILNTITNLRSLGMNYVGTYESQTDRDSLRVFDINGIKLAVLSYTYGVNGNKIPKDGKYLVNVIDTLQIRNDLLAARSKNVDAIMVYYHFGEEYQREANAYQKEIVDFSIQHGADIIIGSHPHVIQPMKYFQTKNENFREGFVAYSLGNFISNQRWRYSDCGVILKIKLTKNIFTNRVRISNISYLPTWVYKGKIDAYNRFVILPSDTNRYKLPVYLSKTDKLKLIQSYSDSEKLLANLHAENDSTK